MWPDRHEHRDKYSGHVVHSESPASLREVKASAGPPGGRTRRPRRPAKKCSQVDRPISTGKLNALLRLHLRPINLVVYQEPDGETISRSGLHAYMLSAFILSARSYPALPLARQLVHQGCVRPNPLVLGTNLLRFPTPVPDRDRPVSRRSEPSSRTAFIGEQPNPWDLLQPQDAMSRHRGAKPPRRYGLLGEISLLSPEYLLSDELRPFHTGSQDH